MEDNKNHRFFRRHSKLARMLRPLLSEKVVVSGFENLIDEEGPFIFLLNHRGYYDVPDLLPVWQELPINPPIHVVGRENYIKVKGFERLFHPMNSLFSWYISPMISTVNRISTDKHNLSEEKQRDCNEKGMYALHLAMEEGYSTAILPEGTTKSNGAIGPLKKWGVWRLAHRIGEKGNEPTAKIIPIGNTTEFMAGKSKRHLTYANIGELFEYSPVEKDENESLEDYNKKDQGAFSNVLREKLTDLQTFTVSQFGGLYLRYLIDNKGKKVLRNELSHGVEEFYNVLEDMDDGRTKFFDYQLLGEKTEQRFDRFYDRLKQEDYLTSDDRVNLDRLAYVPKLSKYKKENPLRYMSNNLLGIAKDRKGVKESLEKVLKIDLNSIEIR